MHSRPSPASKTVLGADFVPDYAMPRLLCDEMLQGLGRWLRAAGYDTEIVSSGLSDRQVYRHALAEARILLTCDREFAARRQARHRVVVLAARDLESGARELRARLRIDWLRAPLTRCLRDNTPLIPAAPEARRHLPPKARGLAGPLRSCPGCARLYWPGSHARRMQARLTAWQDLSAPPDCGPIIGEARWPSN